MKAMMTKAWLRWTFCGLGLLACLGATGCQSSIGGQTLPSPYYIHDDVQYFPPGTEFKLPREAAAMRAYRAERELQQLSP
jgi:hypothetical protein